MRGTAPYKKLLLVASFYLKATDQLCSRSLDAYIGEDIGNTFSTGDRLHGDDMGAYLRDERGPISIMGLFPAGPIIVF